MFSIFFKRRLVAGCVALVALWSGIALVYAAGPAWAIVHSPSAEAAHGYFSGVSCTSTTLCEVVGSYINRSGKVSTLAEAASGGTWTIQSTPNPSGSLSSGLASISCPTANSCVAVGSTSKQQFGSQSTLAEAWNGTSWTILSTPDPGGTTSSLLASVSCPSTSSCVAVGFSFSTTSGQMPLAETWNGSAWTIAATPLPAGAIGGSLSGASCAASTLCSAVGSYSPGTGGQASLAESWNGTTWTVQPTPGPAGASSTALSGIACPSPTACSAVGLYATTGPEQPMAEGWNGSVWTVQTTPAPKGSFQGALDGVSCVSASACTAVGFASFNTADRSLAEVWNGSTWVIQKTPNPPGEKFIGVAGVSCATSTACMAVGWFGRLGVIGPGSDSNSTLAELWNGTLWAIQPSLNPTGVTLSGLSAVSCASSTSCAAVGTYQSVGHGQQTWAERWNGRAWRRVATPLPPAAISSDLTGVSCTSPTACTAVGAASMSLIGTVTLAMRWNGTAWTIQSTPNATGGNPDYLSAVSCASATSCMAVGASSGPGTQSALAEQWDGTSWTIVPVPAPVGFSNTQLAGVSCTSTNACTAVGNTSMGGPISSFTLVEQWDGTVWTVQTSPNPAGATSATLSSVSCAAATACTAVGSAQMPGSVTLAESWDGTSWTIQPTPNPAGSTFSSLKSVSCTSSSACTGVGNYATSAGGTTLAEAWNGTSWSVQNTPAIKGAFSVLSGVSCTSSASCFAVGELTYVPYTAITLTERYS